MSVTRWTVLGLTNAMVMFGCSGDLNQISTRVDQVPAEDAQGGSAGSRDLIGGALPGAPAGGGSTHADDECASSALTVERAPLDVILLIDRSWSMTGDSWQAAIGALSDFVGAETSTGINVGLLYFPDVDDHSPMQCSDGYYDKLDVSVGLLPENADELLAAFEASSPASSLEKGTPMLQALNAAIDFAAEQRVQDPTHNAIVVLATDGEPACSLKDQSQLVSDVADAAAGAAADGIATYVIGMVGASVQALDAIAMAGGTGAAINTSDIDDFSAKMTEIQLSASSCEFSVPESGDLDFSKVAVTYTSSTTEGDEELPYVEGECGDAFAWHYDDPEGPSTIVLCAAACEMLKTDSTMKIEAAYGCPPLAVQ